MSSEIQSSIDDEASITRRSRDTPEARGIDAEVRGDRGSELRRVQHIDGIHTHFELRAFGNPDALDQVHIQPQQWRPFDPSQPKSTDLSGLRIHQQTLSLGIRDGLVAEGSTQSVQRRDAGARAGIADIDGATQRRSVHW